jgi:hypothetical protein
MNLLSLYLYTQPNITNEGRRTRITMIDVKKIFLLGWLLVSLFGYSIVDAQQPIRIEHIKGTRTVQGIGVKVTKTGQADSLYYCGEDTGPYYLGYNYGNPKAGDGSYTFTFSKPVDEVIINLAALSHSYTYGEEARIYINGQHYKVPKIGSSNSCAESLSIITVEGDIRPCLNCSGSGTNGIKIKGPITTLTIEAHILNGEPMGFVVGVWMVGKAAETNNMASYQVTWGENPAGTGQELVIEGNIYHAEIQLKNSLGELVNLSYKQTLANKLVIDASEIPPGEYILEIKRDHKTEQQKINLDE